MTPREHVALLQDIKQLRDEAFIAAAEHRVMVAAVISLIATHPDRGRFYAEFEPLFEQMLSVPLNSGAPEAAIDRMQQLRSCFQETAGVPRQR